MARIAYRQPFNINLNAFRKRDMSKDLGGLGGWGGQRREMVRETMKVKKTREKEGKTRELNLSHICASETAAKSLNHGTPG